jgi:predicted secreted hydrolase
MVDVSTSSYLCESLVDQATLDIVERRLRHAGGGDSHARRAFLEMHQSGALPHPDSLMRKPATVDPGALGLDYDGRHFRQLGTGRYRLELVDAASKNGCVLDLTFEKRSLRQGELALLQGGSWSGALRCFVPRVRVRGRLTLDGSALVATSGSGWYEREFGDADDEPIWWPRGGEPSAPRLRIRLSLQLEDGCALSIAGSQDGHTGRAPGYLAVVCEPGGAATRLCKCALIPSSEWTSTKTFVRYPTGWRLQVSELDLQLEVRASFHEQELESILNRDPSWVGRVEAEGLLRGRLVRGVGLLECGGFEAADRGERA